MKKILATLMLLMMIVPPVWAGLVMGGSVVSSGGDAAAGTTLIGSNDISAGSKSVQNNWAYKTSTSIFTATASGYLTTAYVYGAANYSNNFRVGVYDSSDNLLEESTVGSFSGTSWRTATFAGTTHITSGTTYWIVVVANDYIYSSGTDALVAYATDSIAGLPDPFSVTNTGNTIGTLAVYVTN
jgi:hypothetical protein